MKGFEMKSQKPLEVQRALHDADTSALRAMGRVGGKEAGRLSALHADFRALDEAVMSDGAKAHEESILKEVPESDQ
jgi:hypothetical protein